MHKISKLSFRHIINSQNRYVSVLFIILVASLGTILMIVSHATSPQPFATLAADNGSITSPANIQSCAGSTGGSCVVFGSSTNVVKTNCFSSPGACGFPDPAYSNVGVKNCSSLTTFDPSNLPAGTYYSGSGNNLEITGSNITLAGYNFNNWSIYIASGANTFTLNNDCITYNGDDTNQTQVIGEAAGDTGLTIENSNIGGANNSTEAVGAVLGVSNATIENNYLYNTGDDINGENDVIENNYMSINTTPSGSHNDNLYFSDGTETVTGNTIFNSQEQTDNIFGDSVGAVGGVCDNHLTLTNNLMAGGGFMIYPCSASTSVGSSTMTIQNNHFARCLGTPITEQKTGGYTCGTVDDSGSDSHGYWPYGGYFGIAAYIYCPPTAGQVWSGNVWDDDGSTIACP